MYSVHQELISFILDGGDSLTALYVKLYSVYCQQSPTVMFCYRMCNGSKEF